MLHPLLNDLIQHRAALLDALSAAMQMRERTDYVDCWNLLDEIGEHDQRIATLQTIMSEVAVPRSVRN